LHDVVLVQGIFGMRALVAFSILAIAAPGLASSNNAQDEPEIVVNGKPQKAEKKVCKIYDAPTGSRVGITRICRTPTEWRIAEDSASRSIERQREAFRAERTQQENDKNNPFGNKLPH
jgi:hypothetical protein